MMPDASPAKLARFLPFGGGRSIRFRLTLWYVSLLAIVLVGFSFGVYFFLIESISSEVDGVTTAYQKLLTSEASQSPLYLKRLKLSKGSNVLAQISIEYQSRNSVTGPTVKAGQPVQNPAANNANEAVLINAKKQGCHQIEPHRFSCTWLVYNRRNHEAQGAITFQASRYSVDHTVSQLLSGLIVGIPLSLLIALVGGWVIASRALSPLEELRRTAQSITATDLSRRIGMHRDDELGRLAQTLDSMIARLDSAFREQRRLTADVSHELRTPLSVIQAQTTLALKRARSPKEYTAVLDSIQEETERMSRIVEDLLLLARAEAGQEVIERDPVRLDVMARWAVEHVQSLALEKGVEVVASMRPVMIEGDSGRIRQLALNLVHNAVKYTESGGKVKVRVSSRRGLATLQVSDTGVGIDERSLPHIFERFYMADRSRSRSEGGTGLGLAIVQWIVEAHEGTVTVDSKPGEGSTFTTRLPVHSLGAPVSEKASALPRSAREPAALPANYST